MRPFFDLKRLPVQMIFSFVLVVILTAAAVGFPVIWIIQNQLDSQVRSQLNQGMQAAQVLYEFKQDEVVNLALLTSQRPTLRELLEQELHEDLLAYLADLGGAAELDLIILCDSTGGLIVSIVPEMDPEVCNQPFDGGIIKVTKEGLHQVWVVGSAPIPSSGSPSEKVLVGKLLDDRFAQEISLQTGLEQIIWLGSEVIASSFPVDTALSDPCEEAFWIEDNPYFSTSFSLDSSTVTIQAALEISGIVSARQDLIQALVFGIAGVALIGSIFGALLSRRISSPLVNLAEAAQELSKGNLVSTVNISAGIHEVDLVARSLENSRAELYQTMRKLETEREWVNRLLETIVEGIVTVDAQGLVTYFSQGAERISGWRRDQILNLPCDQFFQLAEVDTPFTKSIGESGQLQKHIVRLSGGRLATLSITGGYLSPSELGEAQTVFVFRDISEEEVIHRMLGDFLANITHEFRTPLSAQAASLELLMEQAHDLSMEEIQQLLNNLYLGMLGLQTLVDNLLEGAKIEAGRFQISMLKTDLTGVISNVVTSIQPLLEKYHQQLVLDLPEAIPMVSADERRLEQVLINLVSNASKHGPTDATITIRVAEQADHVVVQVIDQGPGIPMDYKQSIFTRFSGIGKRDGGSKIGTGLGLSIVKTIVEAHGGAVGVEDNPTGGSTFWFTLVKAENNESIDR